MDIDNLDSWEIPEVLKKYFQGGHVGFDKEGSPIWVDMAPKMDWSGNIPSIPPNFVGTIRLTL